jgi:hypothetical protein
VPQKFDEGFAKLALLLVDDQAILLQAGEKLLEIQEVLLHAGAGHPDVIQVAEGAVQPTQHRIHMALESVASVS